MKKEPTGSKGVKELLWGIALVLAGVGVLLRNLEVMPKLAEFESFSKSVVLIFYFIGIVLIYGGVKKIVHHFKPTPPKTSERHGDASDV